MLPRMATIKIAWARAIKIITISPENEFDTIIGFTVGRTLEARSRADGSPSTLTFSFPPAKDIGTLLIWLKATC